jgi:phosphatidylglycerol:prolipoprotein diacylglycerol transferase
VQPVAFQLGPISVHWYGILLAIGFLVGLWTASRRGLREGIVPDRILDAGVWLIVGSVVGARFFFVVSYWDESFAGRPWTEVLMVRKGGLVYYGGLVGGALAFVLYTRLKKLPLWKLADALAPSISLGYAIGRPGCVMTGCCYGKPTDLPWAIHFPVGHPTAPQGVHPTQIYDALAALGLYLALAWLYRRKKFDGQVFAAYLLGYAVLRIVIEFFRGDYLVHYLGGWATQAQLISLPCLAAGLVLYVLLARRSAIRA